MDLPPADPNSATSLESEVKSQHSANVERGEARYCDLPDQEELTQLGDLAEQAARIGGETLLAWRKKFQTREKGPKDLVTDADLASEKAIRALLCDHRPDDPVVGEEGEQPAEAPSDGQLCWVVDPLDGTVNYVHDFPCYAVSVAAVIDRRVVAGAIYDPLREEMFRAVRGAGASLNSEPIKVTPAKRVSESLVAVSLPPQVEPGSADLAHLVDIVHRCQAVRRTGSAALNLAYVACGRLDAHWAHVIYPWDCAAGTLLVEEAGGVVTASDATPFDVWQAHYLVASTPQLHAEIAQHLTISPDR